ncbi:MAG: DUF2304 domain-containing protein [Deltaproteobacteria bacterium]|nr:MAG: DUF2304 domain-containing protein [Deltaproteobacteria bacterium]
MTASAPIDVTMLKALLQQQSASLPTRVVAVVAAATLFVAVLESVRRRRLREEYTPIWLTAAAAILALAVSFDTLIWLTNLIGAWAPSSTVFFLGLVFLTAISLRYAIRLSALADQVKTLAQEIAILKASLPER